MYKKKYTEYVITISYLNGDSEKLNYKDCNTSDYKVMLKLYKETKEQYKEECVNICFCGKSESGQLDILFEKQLINKEELLIKETADKMAEMDGTDYLVQLKNIIDEIQKYRGYIQGKTGTYDKKQDIILHKIENNIFDNPKDELRLFYELKQIRQERRRVKNGNKLMEQFFDVLNDSKINLRHMSSLIGTALDSHKSKIDRVVPLTDKRVEEFRIMKEFPYKNFKERLHLVKQLQSKYDKVTYDDSLMVVTAYTHAK